jgi:hypothetical protein
MIIIVNHDSSIQFPWEPNLLEWLNENYPFSRYHLAELEWETKQITSIELDTNQLGLLETVYREHGITSLSEAL